MKIVFRRGKRHQSRRENKIIRKPSQNMNIKLIKHLIKKIKGKKALGLIQSFLRKYFWSFTYLIFFGKKIFLN